MELKTREDYRIWLLGRMSEALETAYDPVIVHDMMRLIDEKIVVPPDNMANPFAGLFGGRV